MHSSTDIKELDDFLIIIDTGSSASIFKNEKLLKDITCTKRTLKFITNSGSIRSRMIETFKGIKVWVNKLPILNILSLSEVAKTYRIIIDTAREKYILVKVGEDKWMRFDKNALGLYVHDIRDGLVKFIFNNKHILTSYSFI